MERLTVNDAASRLGISSESVRQRVRRGTLNSEKIEDRLYILLTPQDQQSDDHSNSHSDVDRAAFDSSLEAHRELVTTLRAEVEFLRNELSTRSAETERRDVLLREALSWRASLPTSTSSAREYDEPPAQAQPKRRWWQFGPTREASHT